jgi:hypothetical protein
MTDLDALVRNIVRLPEAPVVAAWKLDAANRRIALLETAAARFLKFCVETDVQLGAGDAFNAELRELAETVGFDADEYMEQGFDRGDI